MKGHAPDWKGQRWFLWLNVFHHIIDPATSCCDRELCPSSGVLDGLSWTVGCNLFLIGWCLFVPAQDEEQDPLLNSFAQLKEVLNNIHGRCSPSAEAGWFQMCAAASALRLDGVILS